MTDPAATIRCDACPVMCNIRPGLAGACDRYANADGLLVRVDPLVLLEAAEAAAVPYTQIHVRRATLEDVFLHLTGRSLRD